MKKIISVIGIILVVLAFVVLLAFALLPDKAAGHLPLLVLSLCVIAASLCFQVRDIAFTKKHTCATGG